MPQYVYPRLILQFCGRSGPTGTFALSSAVAQTLEVLYEGPGRVCTRYTGSVGRIQRLAILQPTFTSLHTERGSSYGTSSPASSPVVEQHIMVWGSLTTWYHHWYCGISVLVQCHGHSKGRIPHIPGVEPRRCVLVRVRRPPAARRVDSAGAAGTSPVTGPHACAPAHVIRASHRT